MGQAINFLGYNRQSKRLKGFSGTTSGNATLRIPGGKLIHEIPLVTNALASEITRIELKRNGNTVTKLTGAQTAFLDDYRKLHTEAGRLTVSLSDIWMTSLEGEIISGMNTYASDDIELNVDIDMVAFAARLPATDPTLFAEVVDSDFDPNQKMAMWEPRTRVVTLDGGPDGADTIIDNVHEKSDGTEVIRRLHLYGGASDYIAGLKIKRDGQDVHDQLTASMRYQLKRRDLAPQNNWYHFDAVAYGFAVEAMNTAHGHKLEFIPTLSNTLANITAIIETMRLVRTG